MEPRVSGDALRLRAIENELQHVREQLKRGREPVTGDNQRIAEELGAIQTQLKRMADELRRLEERA
jgi:hypothetical protein